MTSQMAEVVETWTDAAKDLLHDWNAYGSEIAGKMEAGPYKADDAAADWGIGVSLAIATSIRLGIEMLNTFSILTEDYAEPVKQVDLTTRCKGAQLEWASELSNGFDEVVPSDTRAIIPSQLATGEGAFKVRVDTTNWSGGLYTGTVRASIPGDAEEVAVEFEVP